MSRQILAIDIRSNTITAVLLNTGLKLSTVVDSAVVPLPEPSEDSDPLVDALNLLKEKIDPDTANVVVVLPADGALYRKIQVPFKEDNKIRQVLPFELEPLLPIDVDTLKIDFHKNHISDRTEVLAVAIDQSLIRRYMDALAAANFRPQLIVPGGFPLANYVSRHEQLHTEQSLILDVENEKTTLIAINSGKIELVRRLASSVDSEQATEALALRIRQTLTAVSDHQDDFIIPAKVYVTGPGLNTSNVFRRISLALELPTENIDLIHLATRLEMDNNVAWDPNTMNNALALALLEADGRPCANFHRIRSPFRNYWTSYRQYIKAPAILMAVVIAIGLTGVIINNHGLKQRINKLDEQIKQVYLSTFPDSNIGKDRPEILMQNKIDELKKGTSSPGPSPSPVGTIDVLLHVSQLIPKEIDILVTQMTMSGGAVTISGETADFNSVDDIKNRMEKASIFKQVTIATANTGKSGNMVRFKLKIGL